MDPQQQQQDLSRLPHPTEDNLTAILSNRFQQGQYYTRIASSVVVQVNPYFPGRIELSEASLQDQVLTYKDGARLNSTTNNTSPNSSEAATRIVASPQAIELATSAYLHMRRTGQDQSIITRYESIRHRNLFFSRPFFPFSFFTCQNGHDTILVYLFATLVSLTHCDRDRSLSGTNQPALLSVRPSTSLCCLSLFVLIIPEGEMFDFMLFVCSMFRPSG